MATTKQKQTAKENIKKAREKWRSLSSQARARSQPEGRRRARPGSTGEGQYYRVVVRDKNQFSSFRTHDVGDEGHIQRIAGHRRSGSWDTQAWLISKQDAHMENGQLIADSMDAQGVLNQIGSQPEHKKGDIFTAKPRKNIPESEKPTEAQQKARQANIKKAQAARQGS